MESGDSMDKSFHKYFEELRKKSRLTLRDFCIKAGADPANISRMERGYMPPPKNREILERYATALGLKEGSDEWYQFFDLASISQGMVPEDIMTDTELAGKLPAFFRTLRGQKPTPEEMKNLAELIRKGKHS